jgi:ABC-type branched-subunit amino acid transport system ATPase component/ABC-type branched-subunit amino acid transport system permease subunit
VSVITAGQARTIPRRPRLWKPFLFLLVVFFPYLPFISYSVLGNVNTAARYAMIGVSLVVLTGWVGQISLGHAGFVGVGAYVTGLAVGGLKVGFPVALLWGAAAGMLVAAILGVVALRVRGLYLAVATLLFSWMAEAFLFRNGAFTKHATVQPQATGVKNTFPYFDWSDRSVYFYMAWATVALTVFLMANLRDSKTGRAFFSVRGSEVAAASLGVDVVKTKLVAFALSGVIAGAAGGMLMAELGTVSPDAFKVDKSLFFLGIAVVGGLGSLGGSIAAGLVFAMLDEAFLRFKFLSGWLEVVAAALLAGTLLLYRGGLAELPRAMAPVFRPLAKLVRPITRALDRAWARLFVRRRKRAERPPGFIARRVQSRRPAPVAGEAPLDLLTVGLSPASGNGGSERSDSLETTALVAEDAELPEGPAGEAAVAASATLEEAIEETVGLADAARDWKAMTLPLPPLPADRDDRRALIEAIGITVKFGGLTAVNDASLKVCEGEIVGLIGPNGAGKTTLFNSIAGLNEPTHGAVKLFGNDVTSWPVHRRAQLGVGRTFQAIQMFGQLSVFENLMVATDRHNPTGFFGHLSVSRRSIHAESEARQQVRRALELLDLTPVAQRTAKDLPFGVLRMVEVARALVTGARVIMLDEPASGLDNKETDRLADILRFVRSLGVTLLLIEHDVRMVTSVSDYMYVLDRGNMLAEGPPDHVQRDERVIAAYLGEQPLDEAHV